MHLEDFTKKERAFSESRFDTTMKTTVVRLNDNKVVTVITNIENVKATSIVRRRTKVEVHGCQIPYAIRAYN